jgi:hypothetical protein
VNATVVAIVVSVDHHQRLPAPGLLDRRDQPATDGQLLQPGLWQRRPAGAAMMLS